MNVKAYKTHKILPNEDLFAILDKYLPELSEKSVVAIASKVVGTCEGRVIKIDPNDPNQKDKLVKQEADYYLPKHERGFYLTVKHDMLVVSAGLDESNIKDSFSLWPENPQESANRIREYLTEKHNLKYLGIIITDSKASPLRWGVTGYSLKHSGFSALKNYIGKEDIFGRVMKLEQLNIADSLATAAVSIMGEGAEQQPLAVISDLPFVDFQERNPTQKELDDLKIEHEEDIYGSLLTSAPWEKKVKE